MTMDSGGDIYSVLQQNEPIGNKTLQKFKTNKADVKGKQGVGGWKSREDE